MPDRAAIDPRCPFSSPALRPGLPAPRAQVLIPWRAPGDGIRSSQAIVYAVAHKADRGVGSDIIPAAGWVSCQPGIETAPEFGRGEFHFGLSGEGSLKQ
jgi:hypothetical protein